MWTTACGAERWRGTMDSTEHDLARVADAELWAMRSDARRRFVGYARERVAVQVASMAMKPDEAAVLCRCLDPDALTIGFARRFATYKRPGMLLHDRDRLIRILTDRDRPVQLVIAGKAHPADQAGQEVIKDWIEFMRRPEVCGRVLLESAAPQPGERALDVACGTGSVARHVAPMVGTEGKVVALDISPAMLAVARALPAPPAATIEWLEGNAIHLELPDDAFDLVLCQQGLQFFPDRAASVREMRRALGDGGRVAISVWQALRLHPVYEALFEATARHLGAPLSSVDVSFSLWDAEELRRLLKDASFEHIAITPRSLEVHLPSPERFVQLTVLGAATSIPAFAQLDTAARSALVDAVTEETQAVAERYRDGNTLTFPMSTHIAVAYA